MLRLVVGLGNPGEQYQLTRHNIGFLAADKLAARWDANWRTLAADLGFLATCSNSIMLLKPGTFMNDSGRAVRAVAGYFKLPEASLLVLCDDVALPLGRLRLRATGSDGGHNGLKSIIDTFGTPNIPRLRMGIGGARPSERRHPAQDLADYVLAPFAPEERSSVESMLGRAADCVETILRSGMDAAMNFANQNHDPKPTSHE